MCMETKKWLFSNSSKIWTDSWHQKQEDKMGRVYCRQLNIHRNICGNTKHIWGMLAGARKWEKGLNEKQREMELRIAALLPATTTVHFGLIPSPGAVTVAAADATNAPLARARTVTEERRKFRVKLQLLQQEFPSFPLQDCARPWFSWEHERDCQEWPWTLGLQLGVVTTLWAQQ